MPERKSNSMNWRKACSVAVLVLLVLTACAGCDSKSRDSQEDDAPKPKPATAEGASKAPVAAAVPAAPSTVVTKDIQAGIEQYIEEQTRLGAGYFKFSSGTRNLS